jgi:DNA-binding transcriptional MerR regulator
MPDDELLTAHQLAERVRVTYRQLDHWLAHGYLPAQDSTPGTGTRRRFTPDEVDLARVLAALVHAGVDPRAAGQSLHTAAVGPRRFAVELGTLIVTGPLP